MAQRPLVPHELTNEGLRPARAAALERFEQAICKNCQHAIYNGPFIGYEPDLDKLSEVSIWRHSASSYAACMAGTKFAEPGGMPIITLCGSARFMDKFIEVNGDLTRQGNIVISLGMMKKDIVDGDEWLHERLDTIHKRKIDLSHAIYVINVDGYIGESTRGEIDYAIETGKQVYYLEPEKEAV